jgi:putative membrane protein
MKRTTLFALVAVPLAATAALAAPPGVFLRQAGMGDNTEIQAGSVAERNSRSEAVRDYARKLQRDHRHSSEMAMPLMRRNGVTPPAGILPEDRAAMRRLERTRGRDFDRAFAQQMVVDHQKMIAKFEAQARSGDRETAQFARAQLPVLRDHLRDARRLAR